MEPGDGGGLGASGGAVVVAVVVLLVNISGGLTRPMFARHVTTQAAFSGQG